MQKPRTSFFTALPCNGKQSDKQIRVGRFKMTLRYRQCWKIEPRSPHVVHPHPLHIFRKLLYQKASFENLGSFNLENMFGSQCRYITVPVWPAPAAFYSKSFCRNKKQWYRWEIPPLALAIRTPHSFIVSAFFPVLRLILLYFLSPYLLYSSIREHRFGWRNRDAIAEQQRGWHLTNASANARSNVIRKGWGGARSHRELYLKHVLTVNEASLTNRGGLPAPNQPANPK